MPGKVRKRRRQPGEIRSTINNPAYGPGAVKHIFPNGHRVIEVRRGLECWAPQDGDQPRVWVRVDSSSQSGRGSIQDAAHRPPGRTPHLW